MPSIIRPGAYKLPEAAARLSISLRTLNRLIADGAIAVLKLRGSRRISEREIRRMLRPSGPDRKQLAANDND